MKSIATIAALCLALSLSGADTRTPSLAAFDRRAKDGEALTVAFLGGSLTWGANASDPNKTSARALVGEKLRAHYPQARWRFVDAAIGGSGSELGVFRLERDVLAAKPDLVFLDFTINDGIEGTNAAPLSSYESIVRTVLTRAKCPLVPVIYPSKRHVVMADVDTLPRRRDHLKLADYYNLTAADVVKGMNARVKAGELDPDVLWPLDLFDTTHPYDEGYAVYADEIWKAYVAGVKDGKAFRIPEARLFSDAYRHFTRFRLTDLKKLPKGWRVGKPEIRAGTFDFLSSRWMERVAVAENCVRKGFDKFELSGVEPEPLTLRFRGSRVLFFGESTIFSGKYEVLIDGEKRGWADYDASRFAAMFPPSAYLFHPVASGLDPDKEHTLTIIPKLAKDKPQHIHLESVCIAGPKEVSVGEPVSASESAVKVVECPKCPMRMKFAPDGKSATINKCRLTDDNPDAAELDRRMAVLTARAEKLLVKDDPNKGALTRPLMGWSSWNTFRVNISPEIVLGVARVMATNGLKAAGYAYINTDDGFFGGRDKDGKLLFHKERFPNGLKGMVDGIHALGFKAGIYSEAGADTCGSMWDDDKAGVGSGLYGHDAEDFKLFFNDLGFDFIKIDYCGGQKLKLDERTRYTEIANALKATGRTDVRLNICRWAFPGTWASDFAGSWRTTPDLHASWKSVKRTILQNLYLSAYASPGHYNDMDMLVTGRLMGMGFHSVIPNEEVGLTREEERTHFGLWCMMSSPLLIGCDPRSMPQGTFDLMTNPYLLSMNQNDLGLHPYVASCEGTNAYVLVKDAERLFGTARYVTLLNLDERPRKITVRARDLDLAGRIDVLDLMERADPGCFAEQTIVEVPAHGAKFYRFDAEKRLDRVVYEAESAFLTDFRDLGEENRVGVFSCEAASGGCVVRHLGGSETNDLIWKDVKVSRTGDYELALDYAPPRENRFAFLQIDGGEKMRFETKAGTTRVVLPVKLAAGVHAVRLSNPTAETADFDRLTVSAVADGADGLKAVNARTREEKVKIFTERVFGRRPVERPPHLAFSEASPDCEMLGGAAVRRQVRITYGGAYGTNSFVVTAFLPKSRKPAPAFLLICNRDVAEYADPTRTVKNDFWPVEEIVSRGYAALMFFNGDIAPDRNLGCSKGVFECFEDVTIEYRPFNLWGTLSAWAWGASRVMDWIETEPRIDATKVAVVGHSRGGKTALWAAVTDPRFAYACVNNSGCTGAKLNHMDLPRSEQIARIVKVFPYWFCADYVDCANRDKELDFDQHELLSCVAPRLLAVGSGADDFWAGPPGERKATELASEAWADKSRVKYHLRPGGHGLFLADWIAYMNHAQAYGW